MRRLLIPAAALFAGACASWRTPAPGPTPEGLAVPVLSRDADSARREALEAVLPLFVSAEARRAGAKAIDAALENAPVFGRVRPSKKGPGIVEVLVDPLARVLGRTGLTAPAGYATPAEVTLIAFGDRAVGPDGSERLAAEAFETALFGRGIQAQDANDPLIELKKPLKAKSEEATVVEAGAGGWAWLAAGRAATAVRQEPGSPAWRGRARLSVALYALRTDGPPARFDGNGEAVDVSSGAAVARALESAAQEAAVRADGEMARRRAGRATLGVLISGYKELPFLLRAIADLRATPGVDAATLASWRQLDEMALVRVYARGLRVDALAGKLIHDDPSLRVTAIETEDGRLTLQGAETPAAADRGD